MDDVRAKLKEAILDGLKRLKDEKLTSEEKKELRNEIKDLGDLLVKAEQTENEAIDADKKRRIDCDKIDIEAKQAEEKAAAEKKDRKWTFILGAIKLGLWSLLTASIYILEHKSTAIFNSKSMKHWKM